MSLIKNNEIVEQAEDRLQQKDREQLANSNLVKCLVSEQQEVEDALYGVYTEYGIYTAIGAQLDIVGLLVGESRSGRLDDAYRTAILARIQLNVGAGEPNTIINAIKQWMNPTVVDFSEPYPAYFSLFIQSAVNIPNIATIVKEISPAGVGSTVTTLPANLKGFTFGTAKGAPADFMVQATPLPSPLDEYAVSDSDFLQIEAIQSNTNNKNIGFGTAYLTSYSLSLSDGSEYDVGDGDLLQLETINSTDEYSISIFGGRFATVKI